MARIFFYPDRPSQWSMIDVMRRRAGWELAASPDDATWRMLYRNQTRFDLPADDPYAAVAQSWINGGSRDIAKQRVHALHREIFGYDLKVDPRTFHGRCVEKGDENYAKDARIIDCPIPATQPGKVYERLVDTRTPDGLIEEYRLMVIGGEIVYAHLQYRPDWITSGSFVNEYVRFHIVPPASILDDAEQAALITFAARMGLDFGALDVLRDRADGRIYLIDANNTPSAPSPSDKLLRQVCITACLDAFRRHFGAEG